MLSSIDGPIPDSSSTENMTCVFLPPYNPEPPLIPLMILENLPEEWMPDLPQISCTTNTSETYNATIFGVDINGVYMEEGVNSTCSEVSRVESDGVYYYFLECQTDIPVTGCVQYMLPTNLTADVDRSTCHHDKVHGNKDGMTDVAIVFTTSGSIIVFILLVIFCWCFVVAGRRSKRRDTEMFPRVPYTSMN